MPIVAKNFQASVDKVTEDFEREIRQIIVALDQAIVSGTPVDTGRLKANWFLDFGAARGRTTTSTAAPNTSRGNVWTVKDGNVIIHNSLEYAVVIDAGRGFRDGQLRGSEQAEQGILDPAFAAVRARFG